MVHRRHVANEGDGPRGEARFKARPALVVTDADADGTFVTAGNTFTTDLTSGINGGVSTGTYTVSGKTVTLYFSIANVALVLVKQ